MSEITLTRSGSRSYVLNRSTNALSVVRSVVTRQINLTRSSVNVTINQVVSGGGAGATGYTHTQSSPTNNWTITHNLGYNPAGIVVRDSANNQWFCEVEYVNLNSLILHFGAFSFSGTAYLS